MRRFDKNRHIQEMNAKLNKKKNSLTENFGRMGEGNGGKAYFDHILQGHEATEENAYSHAQGMDWMGVETTPQDLPNLDFIDTVNGVEIYYDRGADYYCFAPAEDEMEESMGDDTFNQFTPNRDKTIDEPRQDGLPYDRENRSLKPNSVFGETEGLESEDDYGPSPEDLGSWIDHQNNQEHEEGIRRGMGETERHGNDDSVPPFLRGKKMNQTYAHLIGEPFNGYDDEAAYALAAKMKEKTGAPVEPSPTVNTRLNYREFDVKIFNRIVTHKVFWEANKVTKIELDINTGQRVEESKFKNDINLLNETTASAFEKLCGVKILKEFEVGYNSGGRYLDNKDINNPDDIQAVGSGYVERPKKVEGVNLSEYNKCYNFDGPIIQYVTDEGEALLVDITHDYKEETKAGITVLQFCLKYLEKKGYRHNASMEIQKPGQEPRYNKYGNAE